eukprot:m.15186 g.15186  ORF g.15186 m.15186 type:complete len:330 (+) comp4972_c0_seq1:240-1229(+)
MAAAAELPEGTRGEQLEQFIQEFDLEVEARVEKLHQKLIELEQGLQRSTRVQLIKLPKCVRGMTVAEFYGTHNGSVAAAVLSAKSDAMASKGDGSAAMTAAAAAAAAAAAGPSAPPSTVRRSTRATRASMRAGATLADPLQTPAPGTSTRTRTTKRNRTDDDGFKAPRPTTSRRNGAATSRTKALHDGLDDDLVTPVKRRGLTDATNSTTQTRTSRRTATKKNRVQATPKPDPRLPKTPLVRAVRRGESIVSMNGSPLSVDPSVTRARINRNRSTIITVPLQAGKATEIDINSFDPNQLKQRERKQALNHLASLKDTLDGLMEALASST